MDKAEKEESDKYGFREKYLDNIMGVRPYNKVLHRTAQVKIKEFDAFARKKYKCRLDLIYVAP